MMNDKMGPEGGIEPLNQATIPNTYKLPIGFNDEITLLSTPDKSEFTLQVTGSVKE